VGTVISAISSSEFSWPLYWSAGVLVAWRVSEKPASEKPGGRGEIQRRDVVSIDELQYMTWLLQYTTALDVISLLQAAEVPFLQVKHSFPFFSFP
jgi:hypothetical protein